MLNNTVISPYESKISTSIKQFESINREYEKVSANIKKIVSDNLARNEYEKKLSKEVDYRSIGHLFDKNTTFYQGSNNFYKFQLEKKEAIVNSLVNEQFRINNEDLKELMRVYMEDLEEESEFLDVRTIGTTLNMMREFYIDLYASILRIRNKGEKIIDKNSRYEEYNYMLEVFQKRESQKYSNDKREYKYYLNEVEI